VLDPVCRTEIQSQALRVWSVSLFKPFVLYK